MTRPDISALIEQTHSETLAHQVAKYALELELAIIERAAAHEAYWDDPSDDINEALEDRVRRAKRTLDAIIQGVIDAMPKTEASA